MTIDERDPTLQALFAQSQTGLPAEPFTSAVLEKVNQRRRWTIARQALYAVSLALISISLEDYALQFAHVLVVALVQIENELAAQLLAPLNSIGGLLVITFLLIRAAHRKLFT